MFSQHIGVPHFLSSDLAISRMNLQKNPKKEGQDIYPGNDEDAPTGYFVIKDDFADMSVIYQ